MDTKSEQLRMPFGTACGRLRKLILFDLLQKHGKNYCYRCGREIETVDDLSIEHKIAWLHNDPDLFWDLDNVAFSHVKCNYGASRQNKRIGQIGTAWCYRCKQFLPTESFGPDESRWNGLRNCCKSCDVKRNQIYRKRNPDGGA